MNLFLTSNDSYDFEPVRKILSYRKMQLDGRDVLVVKVEKPIIGQKYGLGGYDPDTLYLLDKYNEALLAPLSQFPIHVYVTIAKEKDIEPRSISDLINIAWASLYDKYKDAQNHRI